jgi:hypothetical protein
MAVRKRAQSITLTGIVIPADWNDDHEVIVTALATADENRIGGNRKGKELLAYLQRQVETTGTLREDEEGRLVITIRRYIVK